MIGAIEVLVVSSKEEYKDSEEKRERRRLAQIERALMVSSAQSPDFAEGVAAFIEKRDPKFSEE